MTETRLAMGTDGGERLFTPFTPRPTSATKNPRNALLPKACGGSPLTPKDALMRVDRSGRPYKRAVAALKARGDIQNC
jgi:hypothetical protein